MSIGGLSAMLVGLLPLVLGKVCLDLTSKQVQGWLFDLCFVVLRVARRRLPAALRAARHDEELVPELKWILFDKYANEPVVGLYKEVGWPGGVSPPGSHRSGYVDHHITGCM